MDPFTVKMFCAVLALSPIFMVAWGLSRIFISYNEAVARNPAAAEYLDKKYFIAFAMTEALAIFSLGVCLIILFLF